MAKTRDDLRRELDELKRAMSAAGVGRAGLVCHVRRTGEDGEARVLGVYYDADDGLTVVVPPGPDWPTDEELQRRLFPNDEQRRLFVVLGPEHVEAPIEETQP
jgi:hypothetical protein